MQQILKIFPIIIGATWVITLPNLALANAQPTVDIVAQASSNFPVINSAEIRPDSDSIWSQVVTIKDPFEGSYLAVLDKNNFSCSTYCSQVITVWTRPKITVLFSNFQSAEKTVGLSLKIGERVFNLDGINSTFKIDDELAIALANAPSDDNIPIRLILDSGEKIDSAIGKETIKAWRTLYQIQQP